MCNGDDCNVKVKFSVVAEDYVIIEYKCGYEDHVILERDEDDE